jgi:hypothetical protein
MSLKHYEFDCPNCSKHLTIEEIETTIPYEIPTSCYQCYFTLTFYPQQNVAKIRVKPVRKTAFLIHSAKGEDKNLLDWFRPLMDLYGVSTRIIEEDRRTQPDWLQKSIDGIRTTNFVLVLLTKRYQYYKEDLSIGWKAPDKCYDEIAMAFALGTVYGGRQIFALVENEVDPGNVLQARAWCYRFHRQQETIKVDYEFFIELDKFTGL